MATWPFGGNFHEFAFGLLYRDGNFYLNLSVAINLGGATTDPQPAPGRGTSIVVNRSTGKVTTVAGGLRTPHGIGWGPDGERLRHRQPGRLAARRRSWCTSSRTGSSTTTPTRPARSTRSPVTKPVLWLPQNEIANSPSTPVLLRTGAFKGQLLFGDVTYGGLQRGVPGEGPRRVPGRGLPAHPGPGVRRHRDHHRPGRRDLRRRARRRRQLGPGGQAHLRPAEADPQRRQHLRHEVDERDPGRLQDRVHPAAVRRDRREDLGHRGYQVEQWRYAPTPAVRRPEGGRGDPARHRRQGLAPTAGPSR